MKRENGGRGPKGQFAKGNKGGPGRQPRVVETTYLETLRGNLTQDRWAEICCKVVELAEAGDLRAFDLLCKYTLPTPEQRIHLENSSTALRTYGKEDVERARRALRMVNAEMEKETNGHKRE